MRQVPLIIVGLCFFWVGFVLFATSARGSGLGPDAMSYLAAAESIARGAGPLVPIADWSEPEDHTRLRHFPPLFPALIALPVALGVPAARAARAIEALAAGALALLLAGIAVSCVSRAPRRAAALGAGLSVMLAPAISLSFFMVLSEPVFLTLWTLTLLLMLRAPNASFALGCCAACCALTRYAGVSVVAAVGLWTLWQRGSLPARLLRAVIATAPGLIALLLWRMWSGGGFRRYAWYLDGFAGNAQEAWDTLRHALAPIPQTQPWQVLASSVVAVLVVLLLVAAARQLRAAASEASALVRATSLLTVTYLAVLLGSRLRADPEIPFDWRILSPLVLSWQLTLTIAFVAGWHSLRSRALRVAAGVLGSAWLGAASWNAAHNVLVMQREGALYEAPMWQASPFATWLRSAGRRYALYSNNPAVLWHLDHRSSRLLPERSDANVRAALLAHLHERPSALLGFREAYAPSADPHMLAAQLGLSNSECFEQVCVWTAPFGLMVSEAGDPAHAR